MENNAKENGLDCFHSKNYKFVLSAIFFVWLVCVIITIVMFLRVFERRFNIFSDFAETLAFCVIDNPYSGQGVTTFYPPIAFLLFYPFTFFCRKQLKLYVTYQITLNDLAKTPQFVVAYVIYFLINIAILMFCIAKFSKLKGKKLFFLLATTFFMGQFIYLFLRGNVIFTVGVFIFLFFWLYKSKNRFLKELSLIFLALAIAIKIYTVFIAIVLLKKRRFLDIFKTAIYSIIFVFVPFLFLKGGLKNVTCILDGFKDYTSKYSGRHTNLSLRALVCQFFEFLHLQRFEKAIDVVDKLFCLVVLVLTIVFVTISKNSKKNFQIIMLPLLCYLLVNPLCYGYALVVLTFPMVYFMLNFNGFKKSEKIKYSICFAILQSPFGYIFDELTIKGIALIVLFIFCLADLAKDRKNQSAEIH